MNKEELIDILNNTTEAFKIILIFPLKIIIWIYNNIIKLLKGNNNE